MALNHHKKVLILSFITTISPIVVPLIPIDIQPFISQQGGNNTIIFNLIYNR